MAVKYKKLVVGRVGWGRIVRNTERFGWELVTAEEVTTVETETYYEGYQDGNRFIIEAEMDGNNIKLPTKTREHKSVREHLTFRRDSNWFKNLFAIFPLELIYNILFIVRRIIGILLPIAAGLLFAVAIIFNNIELRDDIIHISMYVEIAFVVWLALIIIEGILARIAKRILKRKQ